MLGRRRARWLAALTLVYAAGPGAGLPAAGEPTAASEGSLVAHTASVEARAAAPVRALEGRVIVRWATPDPAARARTRVAADVTTAGSLGPDDLALVIADDGDALRAAAALADHPEVRYAEVDRPLRPLALPARLPNDRYFGEQWALHNTGQPVGPSEAGRQPGTPDVDLDAPEAWTVSQGSGVVVAILDAGFDVDHPDLAAALWRNADEVPGNGIDDDGNGYVDDLHGWDFFNDDATLIDQLDGEHGTHVAGTIAAVTGNGEGIAGVAPSASLMLLKVLGPDGGAISDAIRAITYAAANGARVVNASWGGSSASVALRDTIARSGVTFVAAAGNGGADAVGDDNGTTPNYPAAFRIPNLVSVAAVDADGRLAPFSNYGRTTVDLAAPGVAIASTSSGGAYTWSDGTSMAAPHAAGVAALVASLQPSASGAEVAATLRDTVQPLASLRATTVTGGMVNAAAAVGVAEQDPYELPPTSPAAAAAAGTIGPGDPDGLTTDPTGGGPTADQAVHATVTAAAPADVAVTTSTTQGSIPGYDLAGWRADVELRGGAVTPSAPLVVRFDVSADLVDDARLVVLRGAVPLQRCTGVEASPDPCLAEVSATDRVVTAVVRTSRGGVWRFGTAVAACPEPSVPRTHFRDVLAGSVHRAAIDCTAWWGLTEGVGGGRYGPDRPVSREQMAAFLDRLLLAAGSDTEPGTDFEDTADSPFRASIARLAAVGIVQGRPDGTYGPHAPVSRAQMASYLVRTWEYLAAPTELPEAPDRFDDDDGTGHEAAIDLAAELGLAQGVTPRRFAPSRPVLRDQMASFLARLLDRLVEGGTAGLPLG